MPSKMASSRGVPYLHDHESHRRAKHVTRETVRRVEQRAVDGTDAVANVQYRDVDARTGGRLPGNDTWPHEHQAAHGETDHRGIDRSSHVPPRTIRLR